MFRRSLSVCAASALAAALCLAGPGSLEQLAMTAAASQGASDDAAARAKSAKNLEQLVGGSIGFSVDSPEGRVPKTLYELQMSDWRRPLETFISPRTGSRLPENIANQSLEEQARWVEKNSDYVYGGNGRKMTELYADSLLAWEKPETVKEGINIAFADASIRFVKLAEAQEMIRRGRAKGN